MRDKEQKYRELMKELDYNMCILSNALKCAERRDCIYYDDYSYINNDLEILRHTKRMAEYYWNTGKEDKAVEILEKIFEDLHFIPEKEFYSEVEKCHSIRVENIPSRVNPIRRRTRNPEIRIKELITHYLSGYLEGRGYLPNFTDPNDYEARVTLEDIANMVSTRTGIDYGVPDIEEIVIEIAEKLKENSIASRVNPLKETFTRAGEEKAVDFEENVVEWINCCLDDGGVPQFRTRYAGSRYDDIVLGVCWGGYGACKGKWFKNVPEDIKEYMETHRDDYRYILDRYGGKVRYARIKPDIGREILSEAVGERVRPEIPEKIRSCSRRIWERSQDEEYMSAYEIEEDIGECEIEGYVDYNGVLHWYYLGRHYKTDLTSPEFEIRISR